MRRLTFILGGARSGKSEHAQRLAVAGPAPVLFIATAQARDEEMMSRIALHRGNRPSHWQTMEWPSGVGNKVRAHAASAQTVVLDCLTLLVSNVMLQSDSDAENPDARAAQMAVESEVRSLLDAVGASKTHWIMVSNEVGQGVVPAYPAGRLFRDLLGWANTEVAGQADEVIWMVAGIPVPITQHRV